MKWDIKWWQVIALVILVIGAFLTVGSAQHQDQLLRTNLLTKTQIAQTGISPEQVASLTGSAADLASPEYLALKKQLERIRAADPDIRFAYLMGQKQDGTIILYADSEPLGSADYSPPGQVYPEASVVLRTLFAQGEKATEGPLSDRWGTWVSGFVPVTDPATGKVIAVFGMDVDAKDWNYVIAQACAAIITAALLIVVLVVAFNLAHQQSQREQRRIEASEEKFSRAFHANPMLMAVSTIKEGRFIDLNQCFLATLGYSREDVIGKTTSELDLFSDPALWDVIISQIKKSGQVRDFDVKVKKKNLDMLDGLFFAITIDVAGLPCLLMVIRDITERKRAEEALRASETQLRATLDSTADGILSVDKKGKVLHANRRFTELWQIPSAVMECGDDRALLDFVQNQLTDPNDFLKMVQALYDSDDEDMDTLNFKEGRVFERYSMPIIMDGARIGRVWSFRDITENKRAEKALLQANKQLNLLSSITRHDILNHLTALRGYLELSRQKNQDPLIAEFISKEEKVTEAMQIQIEFTRNYQDIGTQAPKWQNLEEIIGSAIVQLKPVITDMNFALNNAEIFADPLLEKVFYNLMENSFRHGDHVTCIDFSAKEMENGLIVSYSDNGVGITSDDKKKLFRKGFGKHTGLGLFLSREILDITGITIQETGEPGKGARFEMTVPKGRWRTTGDGA